jgi:hypothetical protein
MSKSKKEQIKNQFSQIKKSFALLYVKKPVSKSFRKTIFSVGVCGTITTIILKAIRSSIKCNIIFLVNFLLKVFSIEPIAYHCKKSLIQ